MQSVAEEDAAGCAPFCGLACSRIAVRTPCANIDSWLSYESVTGNGEVSGGVDCQGVVVQKARKHQRTQKSTVWLIKRNSAQFEVL